MTIEKTEDYYWLECSIEQCDIGKVVKLAPEILLGKNLIIISFDGDSFVPTKKEIERGWKFINDIAYFDGVNKTELEGPIYDNYDQWIISKENIIIESMETYVNYSGFSLQDENCIGILQENMRNKFWNEINSINPEQFLLSGDKFIYGSINEDYLKKIKKLIANIN